MANLNKVDIPIALEHKSKLDLSCDHITTMGFMTTQPLFYRHMIKGERISLNAESKVRPAPIEVPVYGSLRQNLRYFFVPYRLVFPNWDAFYNDTIASNYSQSSLVSSPPLLTNSTLSLMFRTASYGLSVVSTSSDYDFYDNSDYRKFTLRGRFVYKILRSLGYEVLWAKTRNVTYNALGILAYLKIYIDWYANSQYLNSTAVLLFERIIKYNDPTSNYVLSASDLYNLLSLVYNCVYDTEDYYINAWDNPVSPNSGQFTAFGFADPTSTGGAYVQTNVNGTPEMVTSIAFPQSIGTTYIHEALKRLTDFQKRHALAGARSIDRVLAQYGVITDSLRQQRSIYVGSQKVSVEIGSVYATADSSDGTNSSRTGDYAGAGFGAGSGNIDFTADEEGVLICVGSIIPSGNLVQGYDRNNMHKSKTDFFVPEFDALGVQAIEKGEVYVSNNQNFVNEDTDYQGVFAFSGRYAEYKRPKSFLTGDVSLPNFLPGGNSWHLFRLFNDGRFGDITGLVHSLDFTRGLDGFQYHRIFQYTLNDYEPFYCFVHFNVASFAPCRPLFETYEFESESSKRVPTENGNKVN